MTDAEKIAQHEQKLAEQDQRLIAIEKNGAVIGDQVKQNAKEIRRVEEQTMDRFELLMHQMNAGFARVENHIDRVETGLKEEINRVETGLKEEINRVETRVIHVEKTLKEDINRVETGLKEEINQVETGLKEEINRVDTHVIHVEKTLKEDINRVETNLKNDINRVQEQTIKWLSLIIAFAVIIIGALTYIKE